MPSALSKLVMGAWPALFVAINTNESLVEVSPSTVMRLNDPSASANVNACINSGATQASVAMKPNMVAILGWIMPAPLLIPVTLIVLPAIVVCVLAALGTVSVVMMPSAASNHCCEDGALPAAAIAAGRPATIRVWGKGSMITPVEKGNTCCGFIDSTFAKASQVSCARCKPSSPVPALALPVLISNARIPWLAPSGLSSGLACVAFKC